MLLSDVCLWHTAVELQPNRSGNCHVTTAQSPPLPLLALISHNTRSSDRPRKQHDVSVGTFADYVRSPIPIHVAGQEVNPCAYA